MEYFTTFWTDFDIAEIYGEEAIIDTASRAYEEWKSSIKYITELVMIINHKCWDHYNKGNIELSKLYGDMYYEYYDKALNYIDKNMDKDELRYFIHTLD